MTNTNRHELQRQLSHVELKKAQRQSSAISSVLISAMITLVAYGFVQIAATFEWPITGRVFVPFMFLAAMETLYAKEIERRILSDFGRSGFFRLAEFLLLATFLRIGLLFWGDVNAQWAAFIQNFGEPIAAWFVPEYTVSVFILLLLWVFLLLSYQDMSLLYNLEEFTDWEQVGKQQANLAKKRHAFLNRFTMMGVVLLIGMIFSAGDWQESGGLAFTFNGEPLVLALVVMGYFLMLLLLMSQTQLARLRTRWWLNNSAVNPQVQRSWMRVSLGFFIVASMIALLSPTGFADDLFSILQSVLLFLMMAVQLIFALLLLPVSLLLGLLFPGQAQAEGETPSPEAPEAFQETVEQFTQQPPAWLDTASDVIVWVLLGGVIVFALVQYLRQDRSLAADIAALFKRIQLFIQGAWHALRHGMDDLSENIQRRRRLRQSEQSQTVFQTDLKQAEADKKLSQPRKEVFRLYRSLLNYGKQIGLGRKVSQTPLQYEECLENELESSVEEPLHTLTKVFDDARYSQRNLTQEEADQVAEEWEILRRGMKKREQ
jgi:hypothetical protein